MFFNIDKNIKIATSENLVTEATYLQKLIEGSSNFKPSIVNDYDISQLENVILLLEDSKLNGQFTSKESYSIVSSKFKIEISGSS